MIKSLYTIVFKDKTTFIGGNLEQPKWLEIPKKDISTVFYSLPLGDVLAVSGYEKYYSFIEGCKDITGEKKGIMQLEYSYLIGKKQNKYQIYKINLKSGQIEISIKDEKDNFIQQLNPIGWR